MFRVNINHSEQKMGEEIETVRPMGIFLFLSCELFLLCARLVSSVDESWSSDDEELTLECRRSGKGKRNWPSSGGREEREGKRSLGEEEARQRERELSIQFIPPPSLSFFSAAVLRFENWQ